MLEQFSDAFLGYARYLGRELTTPHWGNYVYWLIGLSLFTYALELLFPWRKDQPRIRKDFWLDAFYMFFNFFLFALIGHAALSEVAVRTFHDLLAGVGIENVVAVEVSSWAPWTQVLLLFVLKDFVHWNVHRLLHRVPLFWEFHKVHHSVEQMGFAAHLRFHWMETVVYKSLQYLPLALIGFGIDDFLWAHLVATLIGHLNHANIRLPLGPLRYVLNNPQMHIWHHVRDFPVERRYGMNFGLSLSLWDYLFGTAHVPSDGRDITLGFPGLERFPRTFLGQSFYNFVAVALGRRS
jgi:sterol desaturase/sphingolipid hydroxylase (fatty acid hydroxylase superfamily)